MRVRGSKTSKISKKIPKARSEAEFNKLLDEERKRLREEFKELLDIEVRDHRKEKERAEDPYEYTLQIFLSRDLSHDNVVNSTKTLWSLYPGLKKEGNLSWIPWAERQDRPLQAP